MFHKKANPRVYIYAYVYIDRGWRFIGLEIYNSNDIQSVGFVILFIIIFFITIFLRQSTKEIFKLNAVLKLTHFISDWAKSYFASNNALYHNRSRNLSDSDPIRTASINLYILDR